MKLINATTGKIGNAVIGPKSYLHEDIQLGEVAICIGRDSAVADKPCMWIIGGCESLQDYICIVRKEGEMSDEDAQALLSILERIEKEEIPKTALQRLASALSIDVESLAESIRLSQVAVTNPITGVTKYGVHSKPAWSTKIAS